jgi:hypothetical protein
LSSAIDSITGALGISSSQMNGQGEGFGENTNLQQSELNQAPTPVVAYTPVYSYEPYEVPSVLTAIDEPLTMRDNELFQNTLTTFGYPISDTQFQLIDRENKQRFLELVYDPERFIWLMTNMSQMTGAAAANSLGGSSEAAYQTAAQNVLNGPGGAAGGGGFGAGGGGGAQVGALINVANENAGVPTASDNPNKTVPQAVWMVQQMYAQVFVPMAILFLLPGAILSQVQQTITNTFSPAVKVDDPPSPFDGILRSVIAIFLIPATQLIVSYSIDTGNSMAYSVKDWVNLPLIFEWAVNLSYNTKPGNEANFIGPSAASAQANQQGLTTGGGGGGLLSGVSSALGGLFGGALGNDIGALGFGAGGEGLGDQTPETQTVPENQLWLSQVMEVTFDMAMYLFSTAVIILGAYQLVLMCYLYLLGPLSAAFFAWPSMTQNNKIFRTVWSNWLGAVITVALWRFYWMVILAIMTQRILYLMDNGGGQMDLQWEVAVFTCLLGLMFYVPFNPFNFDPGQAFQQASQAGSSMMSGQSQGSSGQGGLSGALGSAAIAGGANPASVQSMQQNVGNVTNQVGHAGLGAQQSLANTEGIGAGAQGAGLGQGGQASGAGNLQQSMQMPAGQAGNLSGQSSPSVAPPPSSSSGSAPASSSSGSGSAPPTNSGSTAGGGGPGASPQALQVASNNTGAPSSSAEGSTLPLSPGGNSPQAQVNPAASVSQVAQSTGGTSSQVSTGAPPTSSPGGESGSGSGPSGSSSPQSMVASATPPPPAAASGSGDVGAGAVAAAGTVAAQGSGNNKPPPLNDKEETPPPTMMA